MQKYRNVFEAILAEGDEESFAPAETEDFEPTDLPAGSQEKIELLRRRVEMGVPMWHEADRADYEDLTGAVQPRKS